MAVEKLPSKKMRPFTYKQIDADAHEKLGDDFCLKHGDDKHGIIEDGEFDRLFDHLAEVSTQPAPDP